MPCYKIDGITPVVDPGAYVHPTAVLIGDVLIGPDCYVGPGACLRGVGRTQGATLNSRRAVWPPSSSTLS